MPKPAVLPAHALFLLLAVTACSSDTTASHRDSGADNEGDKPDGGGDGPDSGTTAKLEDGVVGKACATPADCAGTNASCVTSVGGLAGIGSTATPGGYCTGECTQNGDCGRGGVCTRGPLGGAGSCVAACERDQDCTRSGYYCAAGVDLLIFTAPASCLPRPETDRLANGIVGKPCSSDTTCGDGYCADTLGGLNFLGMSAGGRPAPGGYCTGACLEDSECGSHGICALIPTQVGTCYLECGDACDREGYHCGSVGGGGGNGGGGNGGGGIPGIEIPNACVPKPVVDGGAPDSGTEDSGTEDSGTEDSGAGDAGKDSGANTPS